MGDHKTLPDLIGHCKQKRQGWPVELLEAVTPPGYSQEAAAPTPPIPVTAAAAATVASVEAPLPAAAQPAAPAALPPAVVPAAAPAAAQAPIVPVSAVTASVGRSDWRQKEAAEQAERERELQEQRSAARVSALMPYACVGVRRTYALSPLPQSQRNHFPHLFSFIF